VPRFTASGIRRFRAQTQRRPSRVAAVLHGGAATVAGWQRSRDNGGTEPSSTAMKLLAMMQRNGPGALI
jgi:DNA-binding transcriptional regulator YiaG